MSNTQLLDMLHRNYAVKCTYLCSVLTIMVQFVASWDPLEAHHRSTLHSLVPRTEGSHKSYDNGINFNRCDFNSPWWTTL